jgi:class 3 adenylate cyclase
VLNHPIFREIFGDETLSVDQSLEIRSATVLFSDVTGSTAMYERLGDARAYRLIRDHFDLVFSAIGDHDGVAIKTIGDEVMGVFADEVSAVRASFQMQQSLEASNQSRDDDEELTLKIGVHRGPVIAVTLNNRIDYFGRTVNIAARTQAVSGAGELSMAEPFLNAPGVKKALREHVSNLKRGMVNMKGIEKPVAVYRASLTGAGH